jgi:hypothetical protein
MLEEERRFIASDAIRTANVQAALMNIELRLQDLLASLRAQNKHVAEAVDLLNSKITLLERVVALESTRSGAAEYREHQPTAVSISGGGLSLQATAPLALNAHLAIDLVLLPAQHPMRALGRVAVCRTHPGGGFDIGIEFTEMREEDREILIQHIMRKQSAELRSRRHDHANDAA